MKWNPVDHFSHLVRGSYFDNDTKYFSRCKLFCELCTLSSFRAGNSCDRPFCAFHHHDVEDEPQRDDPPQVKRRGDEAKDVFEKGHGDGRNRPERTKGDARGEVFVCIRVGKRAEKSTFESQKISSGIRK